MRRDMGWIGKVGMATMLWLGCVGASAQTGRFDASAGAALDAMRERAGAMKVNGVAVLAYFEGEKAEAWTSRMLVVGRMKQDPSATSKGANLLAVAYSKASEMAETLKDSGNAGRPPLNGEFGYKGGLIVKFGAGYLVVAFSGGSGEEDVAISRVGVGRMVEGTVR